MHKRLRALLFMNYALRFHVFPLRQNRSAAAAEIRAGRPLHSAFEAEDLL